jgi:hypothetical protein
MLRLAYLLLVVLAVLALAAGSIGNAIGPGILHPANLDPQRSQQTEQMLARTHATRKDFSVRTPDGVELCWLL